MRLSEWLGPEIMLNREKRQKEVSDGQEAQEREPFIWFFFSNFYGWKKESVTGNVFLLYREPHPEGDEDYSLPLAMILKYCC